MFGSVGIELSMLLKLYEFAYPAKPTAKQIWMKVNLMIDNNEK